MPSLFDSGKIVGESVSIKQLARQCNLSFPLSLRQFISFPFCPFFDRCIRLHIKVLTNPRVDPLHPLRNPLNFMLNGMREVYSTAGIRVEVVSRENLTSPYFENLRNLDVPVDADGNACPHGQTSNEQNQLFKNRNNVCDNEIVVYFISTTNPGLNGCSSHPVGQPGAVITLIASRWTLAHEVGHVLGLNHISDKKDEHGICVKPITRLMTGCSTSKITGTPIIDQNEINIMRSSILTRQCGGG